MTIEYYDKDDVLQEIDTKEYVELLNIDVLQEIDTKEYVELLNKSIEHYEHMIEWAKTKDPDGRARPSTMYAELEETWFGGYCVLCNKFEDCFGCPIYEYNTCHKGCKYTPWSTLNVEYTWGGWLKTALDEVKFLTMLRDHYDNM